MYLSTAERVMLERTLYNLWHNAGRAADAAEIGAEYSEMSDAELERAINRFMSAA